MKNQRKWRQIHNQHYVVFETAIKQNKKAPTDKCRCLKIKINIKN